MPAAFDERILVLLPTAPDAERTAQLLEAAGLAHTLCSDVPDLCREIQSGAAAALLTEDVFDIHQDGCLQTVIDQQPAWSDFPFVVLASGRAHAAPPSINATFVQRPIKVSSLISVLRATLRSRRHQYRMRDHLVEQTQSEAERNRLMETLRLTVDAGDFGTWDWIADSDQMILSDRAARIYGVEPGGFYQREPMRALIHPDYRDKARAAAARSIAERTDYAIEYPLIRADGSMVWVAARGRGVHDESGRLLRMLGIVQDITERKLAEESLRESEGRHRFLAHLGEATESLVDPSAVMAVSARLLAEHLGADRCAYAEVENESIFVIKGDYSTDVPSIVGRWPVDAFGGECVRHMLANEPYVVHDTESDPRITADDRPAYQATTIRAVICVPLHKEGRFTAAMAVHQAKPRTWHANEIRLVATVVARCWEALERTRIVAQLREADRKKDDFIALLAHELRNPLAPVRNGLEVLQLAGDDVRVAREAREMMERQLGHMVRLIDDLLDVSRISRNKMQLRRGRIALTEIVHTAVETARPAIQAEDHHLQISLPAEPLFLFADLTRLAQVFSNLLTNSAKYTPRGGTISLSAEQQRDEVVVSVRDNGIGIPREAMGQIFDMFSQVDRSMERNTGGLGIGLAIVKGLVEMHGGIVTVESEGPDRGSLFNVTLPLLNDSVETSSRSQKDHTMAKPGLKILVVDDNRDGAASMTMMLKLLKNEVRTANDGLQAIEMAEQFRPDVILMDLGMPRMNGYDATRQIRQQEWGTGIMIVALTGWGQDADRTLSREAGCDAHLVKPVELNELKRMLEACANGSMNSR
ncbi:MAG TPA: ATP-binding protein [Planctomycetaceae bacterium]|nr:ATP-binding protein [Planctomycetaceae bacterium]